jgi:hypothetical protein
MPRGPDARRYPALSMARASNDAELEEAFALLLRERVGALLVASDPLQAACAGRHVTIRLRWDNVNALAVVTIPPLEVCAKPVSFPTHSKSGLEASRRRVVVECASRRRSLLSGSTALDGRKS